MLEGQTVSIGVVEMKDGVVREGIGKKELGVAVGRGTVGRLDLDEVSAGRREGDAAVTRCEDRV